LASGDEVKRTGKTDGAQDAGKAGAGRARRHEVWVVAELTAGRIADVSLELLGRARELADELGADVGAVLIGRGAANAAPTAFGRGADAAYVVAHECLDAYLASPYAHVVAELARRHEPQIVLFGATSSGRDLAPRVASTLRCGLTADCTDLRIGEHTTKTESFTNILLQIRPAFGGNIIATIVTPEHRPQMATVREGVMRLPDPDPSRTGRTVVVPVERRASTLHSGNGKPAVAGGAIVLDNEDFLVELLHREQHAKKVDLKGARVIVAGGAGAGTRAAWDLIHELAATLGGVVGASRAAVDGGWVSREHQVGQTGTTVRPKLYIAAGISGSIQHRAGMDESARILAINTDPLAPIFAVAHYGIIGDLNEVIPKLITAYRSKV
jgi:electron transfer flavoprotein alpha subunit